MTYDHREASLQGPESAKLEGAWQFYHEMVAEARDAVKATERFKTRPDHRAQAYQMMMEAQAMAYNMVVAPRQNHPRIHQHTSWNTYFYSVGIQCPNSWYGILLLDGQQTYRLKCRVGNVKVILMQVYGRTWGHPDAEMIGNYDFAEFETSKDGYIEVILSAEKHEGNWIKLRRDSADNFVFLRRFMEDWFGDKGDLEIEMTSPLANYDEQSEAAMAERIQMGAYLASYLIKTWGIENYRTFLATAGGEKNRWGYTGGGAMTERAVSPSSSVGLSVVECAPDQAIIIEVEPPKALYWDFQIGDVWSKSLDFMHYQTDINLKDAVLDADGKFRAVVAHTDPGVANWMDPIGRTEFTIIMRNYSEAPGPKVAGPTMKHVALRDLRSHLPTNTAEISPQARADRLERRRQGYLRAYDR